MILINNRPILVDNRPVTISIPEPTSSQDEVQIDDNLGDATHEDE